MDNYSKYAQIIKDSVTVPQMLDFYGFKLGVGDRMPCPFHNGKDSNLGVKNDFYHCFVCGKSGDVITFVQEYFGESFYNAMSRLNHDFRLGLPIGDKIPTLRQYRKAEHMAKQAKTNRLLQKVELLRLEMNRENSIKKYTALQQIIDFTQPTDTADIMFPDDLYIYAITHIEEASEELTNAEMELYKHEHQ